MLQIGGPYEPVIWIHLLQTGLNLLFGLTLESFADREMNPGKFRTLRRKRLGPCDQFQRLPAD
jgi:hypothetical protein